MWKLCAYGYLFLKMNDIYLNLQSFMALWNLDFFGGMRHVSLIRHLAQVYMTVMPEAGIGDRDK